MAIGLTKDSRLVIRRLIDKFIASGRTGVAWRCFSCGGRVDITGRYDANHNLCGSVGQCRTPGCSIHWEETHHVQHQQA